jgi:hypothetical protein
MDERERANNLHKDPLEFRHRDARHKSKFIDANCSESFANFFSSAEISSCVIDVSFSTDTHKQNKKKVILF